MSRYARRTDGNHAAIRDALRKVPGLVVVDTHALGDGFPDLALGWRGRWVLVEIKDPAKPPSARRLTPDEEKFHRAAQAGGLPCFVVETVEDCLRVIGTE